MEVIWGQVVKIFMWSFKTKKLKQQLIIIYFVYTKFDDVSYETSYHLLMFQLSWLLAETKSSDVKAGEIVVWKQDKF